MRIDTDSYKEILDTLMRNKSRSLLTGFGVFWGVFMLVALLGGGQGLEELLAKNFAGFAHNSALIFAQTRRSLMTASAKDVSGTWITRTSTV